MSNQDSKRSARPCGCDPGEFYWCKEHAWNKGLGPDPVDESGPEGCNFLQKYLDKDSDPRDRGYSALDPVRLVPTITGLPTEAKARKEYPIGTGVMDYFPDALAEIAHVSWVGNQQHNPGQPLHWDRAKSTDEADCLIRHFSQRGTLDSDGLRHSAKMAWRALALLQKELEAERTV